MESIKFEESQQFQQKGIYFIYFILLALLGLFIYADIEQIIFGKPFGDKPASNSILVIITFFLLALLVLLYVAKFETKITNDGVYYRWTPFRRVYKHLSWENIDHVEIVKYGFVDFGWRLSPFGTVYNAGGDTGLQLILKSGKKVILGTQKAKELANFLRQINVL